MKTNLIVNMASAVFFFGAGVGCAFAGKFYVDGTNGDDASDGLTAERAWKTLEKVNRQTFGPGDQLLFRRGTRYEGQFRPRGSGTEKEPVEVGAYGEGARPRIDGAGLFLDAVLVRNVEHWRITSLEVTNQGPDRQPWRTGVRVECDGYGPMRQIHLSDLYVHDVNGDLRKSHEGCGIFFQALGGNHSRFEGLTIENCHVVRTDRNGICQRRRAGADRSTGVVIRHNLLEDIGGDAIKPWGSNGALVEHNVVRGARTRCQDYAAGIWPWDCDDTVIQFNEVSGVKGIKDGQAFDSDYRCRNSVFQYNYSHDNEGGFMLICSPGSSYNEGTVIRYNISQNDGINTARVFQFSGAATNTRVYNNVIYIAKKQDLPLLQFKDWDQGNPRDVYFFNNIFYVDGRVTYEWGDSRNVVFDHNVFYGNHVDPPQDAHAVFRKPPLANPGGGAHGFKSLAAYQLTTPAAFMRGRPIDDHGGRDLFGSPIGKDETPFIGVHQPHVRHALRDRSAW
jgi:hypothetical protein